MGIGYRVSVKYSIKRVRVSDNREVYPKPVGSYKLNLKSVPNPNRIFKRVLLGSGTRGYPNKTKLPSLHDTAN